VRELLQQADLRDVNVATIDLYGATDKEQLIERWHSVLRDDMSRVFGHALPHCCRVAATSQGRPRPAIFAQAKNSAVQISVPLAMNPRGRESSSRRQTSRRSWKLSSRPGERGRAAGWPRSRRSWPGRVSSTNLSSMWQLEAPGR